MQYQFKFFYRQLEFCGVRKGYGQWTVSVYSAKGIRRTSFHWTDAQTVDDLTHEQISVVSAAKRYIHRKYKEETKDQIIIVNGRRYKIS